MFSIRKSEGTKDCLMFVSQLYIRWLSINGEPLFWGKELIIPPENEDGSNPEDEWHDAGDSDTD